MRCENGMIASVTECLFTAISNYICVCQIIHHYSLLITHYSSFIITHYSLLIIIIHYSLACLGYCTDYQWKRLSFDSASWSFSKQTWKRSAKYCMFLFIHPSITTQHKSCFKHYSLQPIIITVMTMTMMLIMIANSS